MVVINVLTLLRGRDCDHDHDILLGMKALNEGDWMSIAMIGDEST